MDNNNQEAVKNLPRDVFLYILSTVGLIASAISFGTLVFQIINAYLPDVLNYRPIQSVYSAIRWATAVLIVVFPVYLWAMRFLAKDIKVFPEKKDLKIRKWLLYFTVFAAAIVIIIDLVVLIFNFLQGELTIRFILKILAVLIIAISAFTYYLRTLKDKDESDKFLRYIPKAVIILVAGFIIAGIATSGLPQSQRLVRFDERRVEDLSMLESQIFEYTRRIGKTPESLSNLKELNYVLPSDPETGISYEYAQLGVMKFKLCATFNTIAEEGQTSKGYIPPPEISNLFRYQLEKHGKGEQCFERIINPAEIKAIEAERPR